jgi:hypothetical protein
MSRLNPCRLCRGLPRLDRFQPPASNWVYLVECSSSGCDYAECGDTPEEAARVWNFSNPGWGGNVPVG